MGNHMSANTKPGGHAPTAMNALTRTTALPQTTTTFAQNGFRLVMPASTLPTVSLDRPANHMSANTKPGAHPPPTALNALTRTTAMPQPTFARHVFRLVGPAPPLPTVSLNRPAYQMSAPPITGAPRPSPAIGAVTRKATTP